MRLTKMFDIGLMTDKKAIQIKKLIKVTKSMHFDLVNSSEDIHYNIT